MHLVSAGALRAMAQVTAAGERGIWLIADIDGLVWVTRARATGSFGGSRLCCDALGLA